MSGSTAIGQAVVRPRVPRVAIATVTVNARAVVRVVQAVALVVPVAVPVVPGVPREALAPVRAELRVSAHVRPPVAVAVAPRARSPRGVPTIAFRVAVVRVAAAVVPARDEELRAARDPAGVARPIADPEVRAAHRVPAVPAVLVDPSATPRVGRSADHRRGRRRR